MEAIMKIEGFRALGGDIIKTIVNKADKIKKLKKKGYPNCRRTINELRIGFSLCCDNPYKLYKTL